MATSRRSAEGPGFGLLVAIVLVAWGVEGIDRALLGERLDLFGIVPRRLSGLPGVVLSPWLHHDWKHLIANTLTFLGLGMVVLVAEGKRFAGTTWILVVVSGLGTWVIGRPGIHIGASGLIYGYFGYILGRAIWERRVAWVVVGILVGILYGGMIWGVLPAALGDSTKVRISWEGHLAGLLVGLWLGRLHAVTRRKPPRRRAT